MHYEKLQIDDTSFKIHEQLQIFKQPDSQLFYEQHSLLTVENIIKYTEEHLNQIPPSSTAETQRA